MTVFARTHPPVGKRQTKLYLSEEAFDRLKAVSDQTGTAMSVIVEVLIRDHCKLAGEEPEEYKDLPAPADDAETGISEQRTKRSFDLD